MKSAPNKKQVSDMLQRGIWWLIVLFVTAAIHPILGGVAFLGALIYSFLQSRKWGDKFRLSTMGVDSIVTLVTIWNPFVGFLFTAFMVIMLFHTLVDDDLLEKTYQRYLEGRREREENGTLREQIKSYTDESLEQFLELIHQMPFDYFQTIFKDPPSDIKQLSKEQVMKIFSDELESRRS